MLTSLHKFLLHALGMMGAMEEKHTMLSNGCIVTRSQMRHVLFTELEVTIMVSNALSNSFATTVHQEAKDVGLRMTTKFIIPAKSVTFLEKKP
jgi:hypothetical protein